MNALSGGTPVPDLLVIGSGVIGSSVAFHAAREGLRVVVVDRRQPAVPAAASWASAGGVRQQGRDAAEAVLAAPVMSRWPALASELEADLGYRQGGNLMVAESDEEADDLRDFVDRQHANGLTNVALLGREEVARIVPGLSPGVVAGSWSSVDGQADPVLTTRAFAAAAARLGARFLIADVTGLTIRQGRVTGAETSAGSIVAGQTVLAAGAGTAAVAAFADVHLPVRPVALQMLLTTAAAPGSLGPVVSSLRRTLSLKQLDSGAFLIGGGWLADLDYATGSARLRPERVDANWAEACAVLPLVSGHPVASSWYGLESQSIDGLPVLGRVPSVPGLLLAAGFSGHGFAISPIVGEIVTDEVLGRPSRVPVSPALAADRFDDLNEGELHEFLAGKSHPAETASQAG